MTSEDMEFIEAAAKIKESGRWAALNTHLTKLTQNQDSLPTWQLKVYSGLCYQMFSEYINLKRNFEKEDDSISTITWHARNLLEIAVWAGYCTQHEDNARRFYEDAGRDAADIIKRLSAWGAASQQGEDWQQMLEKSSIGLKASATLHQIDNLEQKYMEVRDAADALGWKEDYNTAYKVLSKYAHPTAFQIVGSFNHETAQKLRATYYSHGCFNFGMAFEYLEKRIKAVSASYPD